MKITYRALGALFVVALIAAAALALGFDSAAAAGGWAHLKPGAILAVVAAPAANLEGLAKSVGEFMNAFEEFKTTNDENSRKHDAVLDDKLAKIEKTLDRFEPLNQAVTKAAEGQKAMQEQLDNVEKILNRPKSGGEGDKEETEYRAAFDRCLRRSPENRAPEDVSVLNKRRATLVKGDDPGAGYLLAPPEVNRDIIKDVIELSPMRALATVRNIGGPSLKQPKRTAAAGAARRVGETEARVNTGDPAYGMLEFKADELFARAEISQQMLEDSDYDLVGELRSEFTEQFALKEGQEFIGGSGASGQAEGILVAPGVGETVSGDATKVTGDGLIDLFYSLKTAYTARSVFTLNRLSIGAVRKLKDGQGNYLWVPGIAGNVPNTILGANYVEMPDMPNIGAGSYPIAFGDFRRGYIIVDRISLAFQTDYTTGADNGIVVYRARRRVGGGVRQPETFKKLKVAAA